MKGGVGSPKRVLASGTGNRLVKTDLGGLLAESGIDVGELTSLAELSYVSASFVKMTGANTFALRTLQETSNDLEATIDHDNLLNFDSNEHYLQNAITEVGIIATGTWEGTDVGISHGGTGKATALAAFDALCPIGTKGDLVVYGGSSASVALGVGGNNQILTVDSAQASGLKWADAVGYNPVPVCTSYGTETITSGGSGSVTGGDQACDWVWIETFNAANAPYFLIADSGPADADDFWMPYQTVLGPFAVTNTNKLHFYFTGSSHKVHILWGIE